MTNKIDQFISKLSSFSSLTNVLNPYSEDNEFHEIAKHNLRIYLERMLVNKPSSIFIGEAPGYNGCRLSGVPFTSERILFGDKVKNQIIDKDFGYKVRSTDKLQTEQSATLMWEAFEKYQYYPLLWNAFPFHPHVSGKPQSNRTPTRAEQENGRTFILDLMDIYNIKEVYSVGNTAEESLNKLGIQNKKIHHPANGGKHDFIRGIDLTVEVSGTPAEVDNSEVSI